MGQDMGLIRNTGLNLLGQGLPMLAGLVAMPLLLRTWGAERTAALLGLWVVANYFSLLDLGLNRALVHRLSQLRGVAKLVVPVSSYTWPAAVLTLIMAGLGAAALALSAPWLLDLILQIPIGLRDEIDLAFIWLAASLPIFLLCTLARGVMEAAGDFVTANLLHAAMGLLLVLAPVTAALWPLEFERPRLVLAMQILFFGRLLLLVVHAGLARARLRKHWPLVAKVKVPMSAWKWRELVNFGGWTTVTAVIGPLMVYLDRLVVGSRLELHLLSQYAVPHEGVSRAFNIPGAVSRALFPAASRLEGGGVSAEGLRDYRDRVLSRLALLMFAPSLLVALFSSTILSWWLGPSFDVGVAPLAGDVLAVFAAGFYMNAIANVPYTFLQARGRPDLTAKVHMVELPIFVLALMWATSTFGALGAAVVYAMRLGLDSVAMFVLDSRERGERRPTQALSMSAALGLVLIAVVSLRLVA